MSADRANPFAEIEDLPKFEPKPKNTPMAARNRLSSSPLQAVFQADSRHVRRSTTPATREALQDRA